MKQKDMAGNWIDRGTSQRGRGDFYRSNQPLSTGRPGDYGLQGKAHAPEPCAACGKRWSLKGYMYAVAHNKPRTCFTCSVPFQDRAKLIQQRKAIPKQRTH